MNDIAIRCEGLSKQYRIGERESYKALRDVIADAASSPFRRMRAAFNGKEPSANGANGSHSSLSTHDSSDEIRNSKFEIRNSIWALDDVSFEVKQGEVVGIIGRNGAGKSTLLKILSRITKPTKGNAKIYGRVGSLLEVGTGFHPELTGRENIYLNGAILGMRKAEIERKFDEIVAFAEVEKFIDTPVKRYSSGMYVRLAFSVAAHLEPEVLLVDEVLAVGDFAFQEKCLGRIRGLGKEGRTIILVTHNLQILPRLTERVIEVEGGRIKQDGPPREVLTRYAAKQSESKAEWRRNGNSKVAGLNIQGVRVYAQSASVNEIPSDVPFCIEVSYEVSATDLRTRIVLEVETDHGITVFTTTDCDKNEGIDALREPGRHTGRCSVPAHLLAPGKYYVTVAASWAHRVEWDRVPHAVEFTISKVGSLQLIDTRAGVVAPILNWD